MRNFPLRYFLFSKQNNLFSNKLRQKIENVAGKTTVAKEEPKGRPLYIDAQASTPVDPRVLDKMLPYLLSKWGNPHSKSHFYGWEAGSAVEKARFQIARLINSDPSEVFFTSGATEANNLAIKGCMRYYFNAKNHLITVVTEHKCVLETSRKLQFEGVKLTVLPVKKDGLLDLELLEKSITPQTALVSVMTLNHEIGVIQDIPAIGEICAKKKVFSHTDAAQATGKVPIDVHKSKISLMSMSGHKMYGPKGVGAIFISSNAGVKLQPLLDGGGQEMALRSGTVPVPLAVGFGAACVVARKEMKNDHKRISSLRQRFLDGINCGLTHVIRNGPEESRIFPGCTSLSFLCVDANSIMGGMQDVAISAGSACTSGVPKPSYILAAIGLSNRQARGTLRFGIGRFTTVEEIDYTVGKVITQVNKLREMSPLWEMVQEGVDLKTILWAQH